MDDRNDVPIIIFWAIVVILFLVGMGWVISYNDYSLMKYFAPRQEQVRHETFECSASHTDGLVRELRQIRDQYQHADAAGKAALADTYKHDMDGYSCGDLPSDITAFRSAL
jgi:hypothetical protein